MKNNIIFKFLFLFAFATFISCETTDLDLLEDPDQVSADLNDPEFLFNNIQLGFNGFVQTVAGHSSFTSEVTRMYAMTGSAIYSGAYSPISFSGTWSSAYSGVLTDIEALEPIAAEQGLTYHMGASKIMRAYILVTLVDLFGDVPFSEALLGNDNLNPMADPQTEVYQQALAEIDEAIAMLGTPTTLLPGNDFFFEFNNDLSEDTQANWITAGKTLKLRIYNNIRLNGDAVGVNVTQAVNALLAENDLIDTPEEDWQFKYGGNRVNPNTRHPGYNTFYEVDNGGQYMSNYYMWTLAAEKGIDDPRLPYYFYRQDLNANDEDIFTLGCAAQSAPGHYSSVQSFYTGEPVPFCTAVPSEGYWGRDHGDNSGIPPDNDKRTAYGLYPVGGAVDMGEGESVQNEGVDGQLGAGITPIILSSYTEFIKAELGLTAGANVNPRTALENGIRNSMDKVVNFLDAVTRTPEEQAALDTNIDSYVDLVLDRYDAGDNNEKLEVIAKEYYIALFGNGLEAYNMYRRTGKPSNLQPSRSPNPGSFYRSAFYPSNYVNVNINATQKEITEQVFWDTNPAGFIN